jgi:hypothetical protein
MKNILLMTMPNFGGNTARLLCISYFFVGDADVQRGLFKRRMIDF